MDPFQAGSLGLGAIGSAGNLAGSLAQSILNWKNNDFNKDVINRQLKLQEDNNEYQKYFSENAAQIRAKDLENAGLSKTLAAGSSGVNPSLNSNPEPQLGSINGMNEIGNFTQNLMSAIDLSNTIGATAYSNDLAQASAGAQRQNEKTSKKQASKLEAETKEFNRSAGLYESLNLPNNFNITNNHLLGQATAFNVAQLNKAARDWIEQNKGMFGKQGNELIKQFEDYTKNALQNALQYNPHLKEHYKEHAKDAYDNQHSVYNDYAMP